MNTTLTPQDILNQAEALRPQLDSGFRDEIVKSLYSEAEHIARRAVQHERMSANGISTNASTAWSPRPSLGLPIMLLLLAAVFWLTIVGANVPSQDDRQWAVSRSKIRPRRSSPTSASPGGSPVFIWHGVYRGLAWVIAVMLPPMAIFFPIFTILEDLGYLPRVAFNLDWLFKRAGAHGKQSLTMAMGFGCNAAGVIATRVIDSPRERLIAILTNNFVPCNGRFPTLIMLATVFVAASFPPAWPRLSPQASVVGVVLIGVFFTLVVSWVLSRTVLKGEASAFTLELPPYRRPNIGAHPVHIA